MSYKRPCNSDSAWEHWRRLPEKCGEVNAGGGWRPAWAPRARRLPQQCGEANVGGVSPPPATHDAMEGLPEPLANAALAAARGDESWRGRAGGLRRQDGDVLGKGRGRARKTPGHRKVAGGERTSFSVKPNCGPSSTRGRWKPNQALLPNNADSIDLGGSTSSDSVATATDDQGVVDHAVAADVNQVLHCQTAAGK